VIARTYKATYNVDLPSELDRRIIGSVGNLLAAVCMHKVLAEVHYLHRAGKSCRKYEALRKKDTALEVFCEVSRVSVLLLDMSRLKEHPHPC
jgi:hypothetical protein